MKSENSFTKACFICLFSLISFYINAQLPVTVDGKNIKQIISVIASDEYQGRKTGTPGCEMTEEYFANEFRKLNLLPAGDIGTYFHSYTIPNDQFEIKPSL